MIFTARRELPFGAPLQNAAPAKALRRTASPKSLVFQGTSVSMARVYGESVTRPVMAYGSSGLGGTALEGSGPRLRKAHVSGLLARSHTSNGVLGAVSPTKAAAAFSAATRQGSVPSLAMPSLISVSVSTIDLSSDAARAKAPLSAVPAWRPEVL